MSDFSQGYIHAIKNQCPHCERKLDGFTGVHTTDHPSEGDITVCLYCRSVLVFGEGLALKFATAEQISETDLRVLSDAGRIVAAMHQNGGVSLGGGDE